MSLAASERRKASGEGHVVRTDPGSLSPARVARTGGRRQRRGLIFHVDRERGSRQPHDRGDLQREDRGGHRRRVRHGPRAGPPAGRAGLLGRGLRPAPGRRRGTAALARRPPGRGPGHQPCLRRLRRGQVLRFRDELLGEHGTRHVDLVFSNAGIGGGAASSAGTGKSGSTRSPSTGGGCTTAPARSCRCCHEWEGVLVNTSSVNGLWASLGPGMPKSAYATAKFAVRGFSEALIEDLRPTPPMSGSPWSCRGTWAPTSWRTASAPTAGIRSR